MQAEEEEARQAAERERKRREKEAKKQQRREELGEDYVSEEEEEEEEEEGEGEGEGEGEAPPTEAEEKPKGPSSILSTFFNHEDESKFWVSMVSTLHSFVPSHAVKSRYCPISSDTNKLHNISYRPLHPPSVHWWSLKARLLILLLKYFVLYSPEWL